MAKKAKGKNTKIDDDFGEKRLRVPREGGRASHGGNRQYHEIGELNRTWKRQGHAEAGKKGGK